MKNIPIKIRAKLDSDLKLGKTAVTIVTDSNSLLVAVGTLNSQYLGHITRKTKLLEKAYLLDYLDNSNPTATSFRKHRRSERQITISGELGIGLAVCAVDYLYNIDGRTLAPINDYGERCDFRVNAGPKKKLIAVEAKGTTYSHVINTKLGKAVSQKTTTSAKISADLKIASVAFLDSNGGSYIALKDPPVFNNGQNSDELLVRAEHYSRIFNLIGQEELSRYFLLMRKRIIHDKQFPEYLLKENLFTKIKHDYLKLKVQNKIFVGSIVKGDDGFVFTGVDEQLISLNGFTTFIPYRYKMSGATESGTYTLFSDGIRVYLSPTIDDFENLDPTRIPHYQDETTLSDIIYMHSVVFERYCSYLIDKIGFRRIPAESHFDLAIEVNGSRVGLEFKTRFPSTYKSRGRFPGYVRSGEIQHGIIFTAALVSGEDKKEMRESRILVIDRNDLEKGLTQHGYLKELVYAFIR